MGKKTFSIDSLRRGKNIQTIIKKDKEVEDAIIDIEKNPNIENIDNAITKITNTYSLNEEEKIIILELLEPYTKKFNFYNAPNDYKSLKIQAKYFAYMQNYSFMLMAHRLKIIRDNELYKEDGYNDFKSFILNEIKIAKVTAYNYIDLLSYFGVQTFELQQNLQPSKLIPVIPLLKAEIISEKEKENIKKRFIEEAKIKSAREIKKEATELKKEYNIAKIDNKNNIINIKQEAEKFEELLIGNQTNIDFIDKEALTHLVHTIERLLKKGY